jgi:hypothetical protein
MAAASNIDISRPLTLKTDSISTFYDNIQNIMMKRASLKHTVD